eukprot:4568762-Prymnesium_polylepis.1
MDLARLLHSRATTGEIAMVRSAAMPNCIILVGPYWPAAKRRRGSPSCVMVSAARGSLLSTSRNQWPCTRVAPRFGQSTCCASPCSAHTPLHRSAEFGEGDFG